MPTYRGSATLRFTAGGQDFVLESPDCSAHVREASESQQFGTEDDPGRWTAIGVFGVRSEEDISVREAFLTLPAPALNSMATFDLSLADLEGAVVRGRVAAKRMEEASRGTLLLTLAGLGLPAVVSV